MDGFLDGWAPTNDVWNYVSGNSFSIAGVDRTSVYIPGTRIKCTNNGGTFYGTVVNSAFSTDTTVTLATNDDYSLNNSAITFPFYSYIPNPQGYPFWFNYTPTYSASGSMTFTSVTTNLAKFSIVGGQVSTFVNAICTIGGTASDTLEFTLPVSPVIKAEVSPVGYGYIQDTSLQSPAAVFWNDNVEVVYTRRYDDVPLNTGPNRSFNISVIYGI